MRLASIFISACLFGSSASAQCITQYAMKANAGSNLTMSMVMPVAGTWIGNFNAQSNPNGTITIPGLFGPGANTAIAYSLVIKPSVTISFPLNFTVLTFCVQDLGNGQASVTCGTLDIIRATPAPLAIDLTVTYPNFHTLNPSSTFVGVTNFNTAGPSGTVNDVTGTQSAPAIGTLTNGQNGNKTLTVTLPMSVISSVTVLDQTVIGDPTILLMPMTVQLVPNQQGSYNATATVNMPPTQSVLPLAGESFTNEPLDLPTILPPGNTAHLLMSGVFSDGTATFGMSATMTGAGVVGSDPPDFNCDGMVDGDDLGTLLGVWGPCPGCEEDLNHDGVVDGDDLGSLLGEWG